ncbi:hypothetical protein POM88_038349 [Heracleum sosnowskyi]|uniref:Uncharacterized protein n=1 Tax=Heracleum sosnowskyi TaxID=360622 RepID=A0AAD8HAN6_9APIA|nr:hypothetical protein POM88_038349 [Heracleum sosnowskyi]
MDSLRQKQDPRSEQDLEKSLEDVKVNTEALDAGSTNARNIPFHDIVHKLKDIKDEYEKGTVASVLQYITHLIKYKDKHSMDHYRKVKNHKFPSILEEKFRTMFEPSSQRLSSEKNTFLINHVLVLTLFVDGYRSDISDIAKDLKIGVVELRKHWLELGCKLVREKNTLFATLPVPLTFPVNRQKKRKR